MNDADHRSDHATCPDPRRRRVLDKVWRQALAEYDTARLALTRRDDYQPAWDYFLDLLTRPLDGNALKDAVRRPLVTHLCNQAPYELFHAMGVHPVRLGSGCFAVSRLAAAGFPVLMCPMLKSVAGLQQLHPLPATGTVATVVPTTCDWVVQYPAMTRNCSQPVCFLELPHLRESERGQQRWLEEMYELVRFLENRTGRRLQRKTLLSSVRTFAIAWQALGELIALRRSGRLATVWFMVVANSFMLDPVEQWTDHLRAALAAIPSRPAPPAGKGVFLAGSPILYPNFKLPQLIEAAGMTVLGDDLCTGERIWPGAVCYEDTSCHGLVRALAERYHKGCICPTFADNERRINSILNTIRLHPVQGVVYQVLKGCHPFDIESMLLEERLKQAGCHFLKIETDYVAEDSRNLATRLEAFAGIQAPAGPLPNHHHGAQ